MELAGGVIAAAVLSLVLLTPAAAQPRPSSPDPPPGNLIDIGGRRLHLHCMGQGNPTVMILGAGFSFDWDLVQPPVAQLTRVCTYDPAGTAWSDPGAGLGCADRVSDVHRLLLAARESGPYVLVGLSIGALAARLYADRYPDQVAGFVLVDSPFLDSESPRARPGSADLDRPPAVLQQTPIVLDAEEDLSALPPRSRDLHRWAAQLDPPHPTLETARECLTDIQRGGFDRPDSLRGITLAVVSTANQNFAYTRLQKNLLRLSQRSRQFIADHSGHAVELDQPESIVQAVRAVVRGGAGFR